MWVVTEQRGGVGRAAVCLIAVSASGRPVPDFWAIEGNQVQCRLLNLDSSMAFIEENGA